MSLSCDVTRDLLPLYHDGVCSDESRALVEEHLRDCAECNAMLKELRGEIEVPHESPDDQAVLKKLGKNVKRAWIRGAAAVLALVLAVFTGVNVWWYTQVYQFYAQFAEGKPQVMAYEYDPETGEVIKSVPLDRSEYKWHTEDMNYYHVVRLPDYLQNNGEVVLHKIPMAEDDKMGQVKKWFKASVNIGRELYTYSVHLTIYETRVVPGKAQLEEIQIEECIMLDEKLNQVYLEHWDSDFRMRQDILLQEYHEQIMAVVKAAQAEWPFLAEK
ncbi:MAG: zf-HC2 domain-containing protein [Oscillospiraceae bacterium]|nr:zf-HC2 domain-containing protein [Oscillospiraceae bacterium]